MGRVVRAPLENRTIANADGVLDVFELTAGANNKLVLHSFEFTSDATSGENIRLRLLRRTTTGTGGAAGTEVKNDEDDGAITAAIVFDVVTTQGTPGDVLAAFQWEQLGPVGKLWTPETRPVVQEGGTISLELVAAIPTDSNFSGEVVWEEI